MSHAYYVKGNYDPQDNTKVEIADGTYETAKMNITDFNLQHETGTFQIAFFDANDNLVTPTAGTITPQSSPIEGQWLAPGLGDSVINAVDVSEVAAYTLPVFSGPSLKGRMILSGITGAAYCRASFWRV